VQHGVLKGWNTQISKWCNKPFPFDNKCIGLCGGSHAFNCLGVVNADVISSWLCI